ncbi:MAG: hypothetical protein IPL65_02575 [Lewinellaceae bacterium]|nr:hypothetical protein [Lewinellaceae bacterium]
MAKEKLTLKDLQVTSIVASLEEQQLHDIKGGYVIKGKRFTYRSRWTAVDTRVEIHNIASAQNQG